MKTTNRLLALLLTLCMVLSTMAVTASAQSGKPITSVEVTAQTSYYVGNKPKMTAKIVGDSYIKIAREAWIELDKNGKWIAWTEMVYNEDCVSIWSYFWEMVHQNGVDDPDKARIEKFEKGKTYQYVMELYTPFDLTDEDTANVTLNGTTYVSNKFPESRCNIMLEGPTMTPIETISSVKITGAKLSYKAGESPSHTASTPKGANYLLSHEGWFELDKKGKIVDEWMWISEKTNDRGLLVSWSSHRRADNYKKSKVFKFKEGKTYLYVIALSPNEGYEWAKGCTLTVNGKSVAADFSYLYMTIEVTKMTPTNAKVSNVKLSKTSYTYNGKVQKPSVTVKDSAGKTLKNGTDYIVTYASGCKNVGRYSVKITFKGKYSGTKTLTFDILPKATAKLTATKTTTSVKLTWSKVTGAKGYRVYKYDTKTKKYVKLADTTKTTYTINKLKADTTYKYQVKAYGKSGNTTLWGAAKNISVTTPKIDVPKTLTATQTTTSIKLTWSKVTGAKGYRVYKYDTKTKKYVKLADTTKTSYTINKLKAGTTYKYQVKAYKKSGKTTIWSAAKSLTTATKPATPKLTVKAGAKKATLSWKKITGATGYELYMATSKNGKYSKITTISKGATVKYTKSKLTKGKTYYFKMRAVEKVSGKNIYSAYSAVKSVKVK